MKKVKIIILLIFVSAKIYAQDKDLTVAFYPSYINQSKKGWTTVAQNEFKRGAEIIGKYYDGIGIDANGNLYNGKEAAMPVRDANELIQKLKGIVKANSSKVSTLCIFTHGVVKKRESYLNFGGGKKVLSDTNEMDFTVEGLEGFSEELNKYLTKDAKVILYSCFLGSAYYSDSGKEFIKKDTKNGGEGSFASVLAYYLNENEEMSREVWGHIGKAHTYGNPNWRVFDEFIYGPSDNSRSSKIVFGNENKIRPAGKKFKDKVSSILIEEIDDLSENDFSSIEKWVGFITPFIPNDYYPLVSEYYNNNKIKKINPNAIKFLVNQFEATINSSSKLHTEVYSGG